MKFPENVKLKSMLRPFVVLLYVTSVVVSAELIPNYSDPVNKIVFFDERDRIPLILTCVRNPANSTYFVKWQKDGRNVERAPEMIERFNQTSNGLVIKKPLACEYGNYRCFIPNTNEEATIEVIVNVHIRPFPARTNAVRGTNVELHCDVRGTDPKIKWTINGIEVVNNTRIKFKNDYKRNENAILIIENIDRDDQNTYGCSATNRATGFEVNGRKMYGVAKSDTFVEVRSTLWGIVTKYLPEFLHFSQMTH